MDWLVGRMLFGQLLLAGSATPSSRANAATADSPLPAAGKSNAANFNFAELTDFSDLSTWWQRVSHFATTQGLELVKNLIAAIAIFVIGRWVARVLTRVVRRIATQADMDQTLVKFVTNLVHAGIVTFAALSALNRLGVDTTSLTAAVAAAGLAIGFALQGSLSNFAAGVLLIIFKPFKVGDLVTAGGSTGIVEEIQIFNTLIKSESNAHVIVPNNAITNGTITNFSAEKIRRIDLVIRCGYDDDLRRVKRFLVELLMDDERILQLPPPHVAVDQLEEKWVSFVVQPWVKVELYAVVRADLLETIKLGFEHHGFHTPGVIRPAPLAKSA